MITKNSIFSHTTASVSDASNQLYIEQEGASNGKSTHDTAQEVHMGLG